VNATLKGGRVQPSTDGLYFRSGNFLWRTCPLHYNTVEKLVFYFFKK